MQDATEQNLAKIADAVDFDESGCWLWCKAVGSSGYGQAHFAGFTTLLVHRVAYELLVEPIPDGLVIDHLCRVKRCCNPDHLELVTVVGRVATSRKVTA